MSLSADGACATSVNLAVRPFQPSEIPLDHLEFTYLCCSHAAEPVLLVAAVAGRQAERRYVARHAALRSRWWLHRDVWRILLSELASLEFLPRLDATTDEVLVATTDEGLLHFSLLASTARRAFMPAGSGCPMPAQTASI